MSEIIKTETTLIPLADHARLNLPFGPRTVDRRIREDGNFPQIIRIGTRRFVEAGDLERYRRILIERGKETPPVRRVMPHSAKAAAR